MVYNIFLENFYVYLLILKRGRGAEREEWEFEAGFVLSAKNPMWGSNSLTVRSWPEPKSDA